MNFYDVIRSVAEILSKADVPYTINECYDGWQLRFPWSNGDIICHSGSYGSAKGHVESYMFPWDEDDVTELTPKEAAGLITIEYIKRGE